MTYSQFPRMPDEKILGSRILIVDDEETNVRLLEYLLYRDGYRSIRSTTNPQDVVRIYEEYYPDLVLLDLVMPGMGGIEILKKLQNVKRKTYPVIIVITANDNDEAKVRSLALGALDFLAKPFNRVEVVERIRKMLSVEPVLQSR